MKHVLIEHRHLEYVELEAEEALDTAQSHIVELLNKAKKQLQWMRKQKTLAKERGLKLTGTLSDKLESEKPSSGSQGIPPADAAPDWSNINFDKLGIFDFGDTIIKDTGSTGGS